MYIYDTGKGFNIIVDWITDELVRSHCDLEPRHNKISLIRLGKSGDAFFKRLGLKVYLKDLGDEYTVI